MEKHILSDGCKVFYDIYNEDCEKTVVLIHGFGVTGRMWEPQLEALRGYKVIVPDVRCHGRSRPCGEFNILKAAADVKMILEAEHCKKAVIAGLSMGGYTAQEIGRLCPEITECIIVASATPVFMKYPRWETVSLKYSDGMLKLFPWEYLKKYMSRYTSTDITVRQKLYDMFSEMTKEEFIVSWSGISTCLHEEKTKFPFPLCFIYGEHDKSGTIKLHAADWVKLYPHCKTHRIENASHMANMDNPAEFNRIMLDFIESTARPEAPRQ